MTATDVLTTCAVVIFRVKVKKTTTQFVERSVTVNNNSPIQDSFFLSESSLSLVSANVCCLLFCSEITHQD